MKVKELKNPKVFIPGLLMSIGLLLYAVNLGQSPKIDSNYEGVYEVPHQEVIKPAEVKHDEKQPENDTSYTIWDAILIIVIIVFSTRIIKKYTKINRVW